MITRKVLFNHIPKTGGITLRIILNRICGEERIFLIKSTDIGGSLKLFNSLSQDERDRFAVIAGHGAELFLPFLDDPFRVTILREPVSLFLSQYYYLKVTGDAGFYHDVSRLKSVEDYLGYAIEKGQDNLLTRYLSNSVQFLADPAIPVPDLRQEGGKLLTTALKSLHEYDAVIDLADFDAGIFFLADKLGWKKIPVYRPANRNKFNPGSAVLSKSTNELLKEALKWDIALYEEFINSRIGAGISVGKGNMNYRLFYARQNVIGFLSKILKH